MKPLLAIPLLILSLLGSGYTYREQRALNVAKATWGTLPCEGRVTMTRFVEVGGTPAYAAIARPPCGIDITYQAVLTSWPMYCSTVVHEVGHLLGYQHSDNPRNVMYPGMANYWRCRHSPRWYDERVKSSS